MEIEIFLSDTSGTIYSLPRDILILIISEYIELKDILIFRSTSSQFKHIIDSIISRLRRCNFSKNHIPEQMLFICNKFINLTNLDTRLVSDPSVQTYIEIICEKYRNIRILLADKFTERTLINLPYWCPDIEILGLCCPILDENEATVVGHNDERIDPIIAINTIATLRHLRALEIGKCNVLYIMNDSFYDAISGKDLVALHILGCRMDFTRISNFNHLVSFSYPYSEAIITADNVSRLPRSIKNLNFGNNKVTLGCFKELDKQLINLISLSFGCDENGKEINDILECFKNSNFMPKLEFIAMNSNVRLLEKMQWLRDEMKKLSRSWVVFDYNGRSFVKPKRLWSVNYVDIVIVCERYGI